MREFHSFKDGVHAPNDFGMTNLFPWLEFDRLVLTEVFFNPHIGYSKNYLTYLPTDDIIATMLMNILLEAERAFKHVRMTISSKLSSDESRI